MTSSILRIAVSLKIGIDESLFGPPKRTGFRLALRLAGMTVVRRASFGAPVPRRAQLNLTGPAPTPGYETFRKNRKSPRTMNVSEVRITACRGRDRRLKASARTSINATSTPATSTIPS